MKTSLPPTKRHCATLVRAVAIALLVIALPFSSVASAEDFYKETFAEYKARAESGDVTAYGVVSVFYMNGMGTPKDVSAAMMWIQKGVEAGDFGSMKLMSSVYLNRVGGIPCDPKRARQWAQRAANFGDPESQYMFYVARLLEKGLSPHPSGVICEAAAKSGDAAEDLETDAAAYESLVSAANSGLQEARLLLVDFFADRVGASNRTKALKVLEKIRGRYKLGYRLQQEKERIEAIQDAGTTYASLSLVTNIVAKIGQLKLAKSDVTTPGCKNAPKLIHIDTKGAISGAKYLPTSMSELRESHLLEGTWDEVWGVDLCGKHVIYQIHFDADRTGSARYLLTEK